ncbi:MAG TPA: DUF4331 domain-containing protein [Mycobacteriales bacterium]|jgi:hypothetical protein|nr:DUF4331 domain-containing protein [Mycobacteriales bacterium]
MQRERRAGRRRRVALAALALLTVAGSTAALTPGVGSASSHREAPLIAGEPRLDNTDVYAYVSPDAKDSVTFVANWTPFEEPNGGPNFYPWATETAHDINIDNNGDTLPDITYRWTFANHYRTGGTFLDNTGPVTSLDDPDLNFTQTYTLQRIAGGHTTTVATGQAAPSRVGAASMPNYPALVDQAVTPVRGGGKTFAGQAEDPFFLDLRVFDLLYGGNLSETGHDTLAGYNVNTIALQVPKSDLAQGGDAGANPVIGIWSTTSRRSTDVLTGLTSGGYKQVSRLGHPLVNEAVIPIQDKNNFNASPPTLDARFLTYVTHPEVPRLIQSIYGIEAPAAPRLDLVEVFLTGLCKVCGPIPVDLTSPTLNRDVLVSVPSEELRLNMGVTPSASPNRMGVLAGDNAGFPNGRRLGDDVVDITLQVAEGVLLPHHAKGADGLGDGVNANDVPFRATFPYVALPNAKSVNQS